MDSLEAAIWLPNTNRMANKRYVDNKNYLANIGLVMRWAPKFYGISRGDMELLMYLDEIRYFYRDDFKKGTLIYGWDEKRFERLLKDDWIKSLADKHEINRRRGDRLKYTTSSKTQRMVTQVDKIMGGYKAIPEHKYHNPVMQSKSLSDKNLAKRIKIFNKKIDGYNKNPWD